MKSCSDAAVSIIKKRKGFLQRMFRPIVHLKTRNIFFYTTKTKFVIIHIARKEYFFVIRIILTKLNDLVDIVSVHRLFVDIDENIFSFCILYFAFCIHNRFLCKILIQHGFCIEFFGYRQGVSISDNDLLRFGKQLSIEDFCSSFFGFSDTSEQHELSFSDTVVK